jgi:hypothetical protein
VVSAASPLWIAVPPELDDLPGLFLPDLAAARLRAQLVLAARKHSVSVHLGGEGEGARETAERLRREGALRVAVGHANHDHFAATILADALVAAGLTVAGCFRSPGGDLPSAVAQLIASAPREGSTRAVAGRAALLLADAGESLDLPGVVFVRESPHLLRRVTPGPYRTLRASIDTVHVGLGATAPSANEGRALFALCWPDDMTNTSPATLASWCDLAGSAVRLLRPDHPPSDSPFASWRCRYGLHTESGRELLHAFVTRHRPDQLAWLDTVLGFARLGVSPQEEMFAGNGLLERNRELLANVLPSAP